ncbi:MAG: trigger factor [Lachnospiraceae bacterium]|nr:trigger factor [Lachnospiraceae bacterium]
MKKNIVKVLAITAMAVMLTACGNSEQAKEEPAAADESAKKVQDYSGIDPFEFVTVGDYSNLTAQVERKTVTDEDIQAQMETELNYYINNYNLFTYEEITDRDEVQSGDMVNIDYVGKKDGVAFDGGTASGSYLEIGSHSFIDGFEDGLIGHKKGETTDLNLTFPEDYHSEELAGQAVVFTVTINSICDASKKITPEFDDALMLRLHDLGFSHDNLVDYKADVKKYLEENAASENETNESNAVWEAVYATCEVKEPPTEILERVRNRVYHTAQNYADQSGVDLDTFIEKNLQMTREEFDEMAQTSSLDSAKELLATYAIAKKENIAISQKQLDDLKAEEAAAAGQDVESYFEGVDDQDYYDYALARKLDEYLKTIVKVTVN